MPATTRPARSTGFRCKSSNLAGIAFATRVCRGSDPSTSAVRENIIVTSFDYASFEQTFGGDAAALLHRLESIQAMIDELPRLQNDAELHSRLAQVIQREVAASEDALIRLDL